MYAKNISALSDKKYTTFNHSNSFLAQRIVITLSLLLTLISVSIYTNIKMK